MSFDFKLADGDLSIDSSGQLNIVKDEQKLIQDVLKILFTSTGELTLHPWYGTSLISKAIGSGLEPDLVRKEILAAMEFGLNNLKQLQQLQQRDGQILTAKELIATIKTLDVSKDPTDARRLIVTVEILTKSNSLISESFIVNA